MDPVSHPASRDREHPSELAAAEHAKAPPGASRAPGRSPSEDRLTADVPDGLSRSARGERRELRAQARTRVGEDGYGQQPGIDRTGAADCKRPNGDAARHLDDRQQRVQALQSGALNRHAEHGHGVCAATMPGRAAPPAPAMITSTPRASAPVANSAIQAGVRWADTTCFSWTTPNRSSVSHACCIVSQSDDEPMTTATTGVSMNRKTVILLYATVSGLRVSYTQRKGHACNCEWSCSSIGLCAVTERADTSTSAGGAIRTVHARQRTDRHPSS